MRIRVRRRLWEILNVAVLDDFTSRVVDLSLMTLIVVNVTLVILETVKAIHAAAGPIIHLIDTITVIIFTIEYALRVWVCVCDPKYHGPLKGRLRYLGSPLAVVDFIAILPFYLMIFLPMNAYVLQLRILRLLRLFKLGRYSSSLLSFGRVLRDKKEELLITVFAMCLMIVFASSVLYVVEHKVQPDSFSSIPAAMWWGVSTLTTVGYGDMYPITVAGKFCGAVIALMGIAMFAIPAGVLASGFSEEIERRKGHGKRCPHCGHDLGVHAAMVAAQPPVLGSPTPPETDAEAARPGVPVGVVD